MRYAPRFAGNPLTQVRCPECGTVYGVRPGESTSCPGRALGRRCGWRGYGSLPIKRNPDERLRQLERRWRETGSPEDHQALLRGVERSDPACRIWNEDPSNRAALARCLELLDRYDPVDYATAKARWDAGGRGLDLIRAIRANRRERGHLGGTMPGSRWALCESCGWRPMLFECEPFVARDGSELEDCTCTRCGWMQTSEEGAAAEVCTMATWHGSDAVGAYREMRKVALSADHGRYDDLPLDPDPEHVVQNPPLRKRKKRAYMGKHLVREVPSDVLEDNLVIFGPFGPVAQYMIGTYSPETYIAYLLLKPEDQELFVDAAQGNGRLPLFMGRRMIGGPGTIKQFWSNRLAKKLAGAFQFYVDPDAEQIVGTHLAVKPAWGRQGVASRIVRYVQDQYPGYELLLHDLTEQGRAWMEGSRIGREYGV